MIIFMKVNFVSEWEILTGKENMEKDLAMLDFAISNNSEDLFVRFYGWKPKCISLGRNQKVFESKINVDTVRRPTGGRALLHDNEITYCVVGKIQENQSVIETYKMVSSILINGFKKLGIELNYAGEKGGNQKYCMNISSGADICFQGRKFIGSAQFRKEGYFLQHGAILKDVDFDFLKIVFNEEIEKDKIITLNEINPNLADKEIISALKEAFIDFEKSN